MQASNRIALRIERGTSIELADRQLLDADKQLLEAAGRALAEAQDNLNHPHLQKGQRLTQEQVVELSIILASEAWDAAELPGEAPVELLHGESSAWGGSDLDSEKLPWLILAADVLDFAALVMGTSDSLVLEVQS